MSLEDLLKRVESATGPDRQLDCAISDMRGGSFLPHKPDPYSWMMLIDDTPVATERFPRIGMITSSDFYVPKYTASLDIALALVEEKLPGTYWHVAKGKTRPDEPLFGAELVSPEHGGVNVAVEHESSAALALLSALLRALISQNAAPKADLGGEA